MAQPTESAQNFAHGLTEKFKSEQSPKTYEASAGRRFDRIASVYSDGGQSVHAFVERETGRVFKAAGWAAPAKGARYDGVEAALAAADPYGSYLYAR